VHLRQTVASIDMDEDSDGKRVKGITLANGKVIRSSRWRHLQRPGMVAQAFDQGRAYATDNEWW
jgi:hypothetical protein